MKIGSFKIPNKGTITARTSSLTNSFVASLMPYVKPSLEDFSKALKILGMTEQDISCAYCGGKHTEWDHLRPFVYKRRPTGFYTTIYNLVPACGKCNQSKGNSHWLSWMRSVHRNLPDLKRRIKVLGKYEKAGKVRPISVEKLIGKEVFDKYMGLCDEIIVKMKEAHKISRELNTAILGKSGFKDKGLRKTAGNARARNGVVKVAGANGVEKECVMKRNCYTEDELILCAYAALYNQDDFGGIKAIHQLGNRSSASIKLKIQNFVAMLNEEGLPCSSNVSPLSGMPQGKRGRRTHWEILRPLTHLSKKGLRRKCCIILTAKSKKRVGTALGS